MGSLHIVEVVHEGWDGQQPSVICLDIFDKDEFGGGLHPQSSIRILLIIHVSDGPGTMWSAILQLLGKSFISTLDFIASRCLQATFRRCRCYCYCCWWPQDELQDLRAALNAAGFKESSIQVRPQNRSGPRLHVGVLFGCRPLWTFRMTSPGVSISPLAGAWCLGKPWCFVMPGACLRGTPEPLKLWRMQHSLTQRRSSLSSPRSFVASLLFFKIWGKCLQITFDHDFDGHVAHVYTSSNIVGIKHCHPSLEPSMGSILPNCQERPGKYRRLGTPSSWDGAKAEHVDQVMPVLRSFRGRELSDLWPGIFRVFLCFLVLGVSEGWWDEKGVMNGYDMMVTFEWSWTWQVFFGLWDGVFPSGQPRGGVQGGVNCSCACRREGGPNFVRVSSFWGHKTYKFHQIQSSMFSWSFMGFYSNSSNLSLFTSDVSKHVVPLPSIWIVFFVPFDCWVGFGWVWLGLVCVGFVWLFGLVGIYETKTPNRIFNLYSCVLGWNIDKRYNIHKVYIYIESLFWGCFFPFWLIFFKLSWVQPPNHRYVVDFSSLPETLGRSSASPRRPRGAASGGRWPRWRAMGSSAWRGNGLRRP